MMIAHIELALSSNGCLHWTCIKQPRLLALSLHRTLDGCLHLTMIVTYIKPALSSSACLHLTIMIVFTKH